MASWNTPTVWYYDDGTAENRYLKLTITEAVDSINNKSTLTWTLESLGGSMSWFETGATTIIINGTQVYYKKRVGSEFPGKRGSISGTIDVTHYANGTMSVAVVFKTTIWWGEWNIKDYGGTMTLTTIDRNAPTVSCSTEVVSSSSFKITATSTSTCDRWDYSLDNGSTWTSFSTASGTSKSVTLTNKASQSYNVKVRARKSVNHLYGTSGNSTVDIGTPTITFNTSNVTANSIYINASSSVTCDVWQYSIDNGTTWTQFSTTAGTSATKTITGLTPNGTYNIKVRARKKSNGLYGTSAATSITTLGGSVLNSVAVLNIDDSNPVLSLNWTVYDSTYTHSLVIKNGSTSVLTITGLNGSKGTNNKTYTLSAAQRSTILNAMSSLASFTATYVLTTSNGSSQVGDSSSFTGTIQTSSDNSAPVFTNFTFKDNYAATVNITGDNQIFIKGYSKLLVTCTAATAKNSASIVCYIATIGSTSKQSTTTSVSYDTISSSGELTLTVTAVDSRGYSASVSKKIQVVNYEDISVTSWRMRRINEVEAQTQLSFEGTLSAINIDSESKNALLSVKYRYKKTTAASWSSWYTIGDITCSSTSFSYESLVFITLDAAYSYNVQITATDKLSSYTFNIVLNKGTPLMAFRSQKVGINNVDPQSALDVIGDIRMNGYIVQGFIGALDSSVDLNDVTSSGIYSTPINSTDLHYPVHNSVGVLEVIQLSDIFLLQRFTSVSGQVYCRGKYNTTWHDWA